MANGSHYSFVQDGCQVQQMTVPEIVPIMPEKEKMWMTRRYDLQTGEYPSTMQDASKSNLLAPRDWCMPPTH